MKINTNNYEEYFLLYIDNELSGEQKAAVELFVLENPAYQKKLSLLQQTILIPASIEFEDKILLYRLEEMESSLPTSFKQTLYRKETKVVTRFFGTYSMRTLSGIAAILILLFGYKFMHSISTAQNNSEALANNTNSIKTKSNAGYLNKTSNKPNNSSISTISKAASKIVYTTSIVDKPQTIIDPSEKKYNRPTQNENTIASAFVITNAPEDIVKNVPPITTAEPITSSEVLLASESKEAFENLNTENPDRVIYIANMEIDGDKLRGITRRIGAFIKRNKTEKEK